MADGQSVELYEESHALVIGMSKCTKRRTLRGSGAWAFQAARSE
jgi:hypothetical protein